MVLLSSDYPRSIDEKLKLFRLKRILFLGIVGWADQIIGYAPDENSLQFWIEQAKSFCGDSAVTETSEVVQNTGQQSSDIGFRNALI